MQSSYLINRNGRYYVRFRVPCDLVGLLGRSEIQRSLRVSDGRVARRIARSLHAKVEESFALARHQRAYGDEEGCRKIIAALQAGLPVTRRDLIVGGHEFQVQAQSPLTLSAAGRLYVEDRSASWVPKTRQMHEFASQLLVSIIGDKALTAVSRQDCRHYRDMLTRLPANLTKRYPGIPLEQVIALKPEPMKAKSVNAHLMCTVGLFNWCVRERLMKDNPARGLFVPISRRVDLERDVFSLSHLQALFNSLSAPMGARYWIPFVALYSGMRLEEIAQLRVVDVREAQGVWVFDVNAADGKHLKTASSRRLVPIHVVLVQRGILDHREQLMRDGQQQLWPDLKRASDGYYSSAFSKWFGRYKRSVGIENRKLTFHSFRHTFINSLKQMNVSELVIKELVGHSNESITTARYGKRFEPDVLKKVVDTLDFRTAI